jgi:hypothetical protein
MTKAPKEKQTIEQLLEREKKKTRRIVTAVVFAVGILIGTIVGYFQAINIITDTQNKIVNSIEVSVKDQK